MPKEICRISKRKVRPSNDHKNADRVSILPEPVRRENHNACNIFRKVNVNSVDDEISDDEDHLIDRVGDILSRLNYNRHEVKYLSARRCSQTIVLGFVSVRGRQVL